MVISESNPLILASQSPQRQDLLRQMRIPFRVAPSQVPEEDPGGFTPGEMAAALAVKKALHIHSICGAFWVLGADTLVAVEDRILGKPRDPAEAKEMLQLLAGKSHEVVTGFCIVDSLGRPVHTERARTVVHFRDLDDGEVEAYIRTGEPFGKAGAYAIQGIGAFMVESIAGSYTNVVGLPVCAVVKALLLTGALERFPLDGP